MSDPAHKLEAVPLAKVQDILREVQSLVDQDKYAVLEGLLDSYVQITVALSQKTATLARLRRMFGIKTSERLQPEPSETTEEPACEDATAEPPKPDGDTPSKDHPPKKRPNHGRRPTGAYVRWSTTYQEETPDIHLLS